VHCNSKYRINTGTEDSPAMYSFSAALGKTWRSLKGEADLGKEMQGTSSCVICQGRDLPHKTTRKFQEGNFMGDGHV
jgi:hypothetical protein